MAKTAKKQPEWATAQFANQPESAATPAVAGFSGGVEIAALPAGVLKTWSGNVRQQKDAAFMAELMASIRQYGVLTSLVVRQKKGHDVTGYYEVIAGEQRLQAVLNLIGLGQLPETTGLICRIIECSDQEASEVSLSENVVRQQLNPADEFEAFQKLAAGGKTPAEIAHKFGVGESTVAKRLKLANVSPKIIQDFRAGKCSLSQLQAFTITDDHKAQEKIAAEGYEDLSTDDIHDALNSDKIPATDKRVKLVGLDTLQQAGVAMVRDMFDAERGYVTDKKALQALVDAKLKQASDDLKAEGWGFVELVKEDVNGWQINQKYSDVPAKKISLSAADAKTLKDLEAQYEEINAKDHDKTTSADWQKLDELEKQIEALEEKKKSWDDKVKAGAGAIFQFNIDGLEIRRGVKLKPQKKEEAAAAKKDGSPGKPQQKEKSPAENRGLTEDVMQELTAHRTRAIGACIAQDAQQGFKAGVAMMIGGFFYNAGWRENVWDAQTGDAGLPYGMDDKKGACAGNDMLERLEQELKAKLPKKVEDVLPWCLERKPETLYPYIALIAGANYDDTNRDGTANKITPLLAKTFNVDYADWYRPTAKNLFGKLGQEQLRELIKEIRGGILTPAEMKLGKEGLAQLAERESDASAKAGKPWLPYPLAQPAGKKAEKKPAKKKAGRK